MPRELSLYSTGNETHNVLVTVELTAEQQMIKGVCVQITADQRFSKCDVSSWNCSTGRGTQLITQAVIQHHKGTSCMRQIQTLVKMQTVCDSN